MGGENTGPLRGCFSFAQPGNVSGGSGGRLAHARAPRADVVNWARSGHVRAGRGWQCRVEAAQQRATLRDNCDVGAGGGSES